MAGKTDQRPASPDNPRTLRRVSDGAVSRCTDPAEYLTMTAAQGYRDVTDEDSGAATGKTEGKAPGSTGGSSTGSGSSNAGTGGSGGGSGSGSTSTAGSGGTA